MQICNFHGATPLGAPKGWDHQLDGSCGVLPSIGVVDELSGFNFMYSVWRLTAEELEVLANGGAIRLGIMCEAHPVVNMAVLTPDTCAASSVVELS